MELKEILELKATKNNLTQNDFNKILKEIKLEIEENKTEIKKIEKIDLQNSKKARKIEIEKIIKIIEKYKNSTIIKNKEIKNIIISYYGDPYITLELCIKSIIANNKLILAVEDFMLGINKVIVEIFIKILKERNIKNTLFICNLLKNKKIKENEKNIEKIICIGNKNTYTNMNKAKIEKIKYYPYNNIDLYCDTENLKELQYKIYEYAIENNIEIEIYDDENEYDIEKNIEIINKYGNGYCSVILTEKEESKEKFKNGINSKKIYINENPFDKDLLEIPIQELS